MEDTNWKTIYKVGGISALVMVLFIPIQAIVFFISPPPTTVIGWFELFHKNIFLGLIDMDLLLIIDQVLMAFVFLALYMLLRKIDKPLMTIALMLGLGGVVIYFSSTGAFEMLNLSRLYNLAVTETEKMMFLSAGQVVYSTWQGTAFNASYIVEAATTLLISIVMLKSKIFSKTVAYIGIVMSLLMIIPPTVGMIGIVFAMLSLIPLVIWDIMVAKKLLKLGK